MQPAVASHGATWRALPAMVRLGRACNVQSANRITVIGPKANTISMSIAKKSGNPKATSRTLKTPRVAQA